MCGWTQERGEKKCKERAAKRNEGKAPVTERQKKGKLGTKPGQDDGGRGKRGMTSGMAESAVLRQNHKLQQSVTTPI